MGGRLTRGIDLYTGKYGIIWSMAAILHDSTIIAVCMRPRTIPLALITMRKSTHGFPLVSYVYGYGALLGGPLGCRSSTKKTPNSRLKKSEIRLSPDEQLSNFACSEQILGNSTCPGQPDSTFLSPEHTKSSYHWQSRYNSHTHSCNLRICTKFLPTRSKIVHIAS